ncbi:hypothetical protein [Pseudonocardia broussonetiae]|uniref:SAF domain-containing protein n=1 Tax=Pseudonocardia broussonetiae TaxID=2736640 RepID=A0A6M6JIE6_9PSEU|nr:hypothetical protein [Pseudonocardia broussonetiae]QJY47798.1 hypothetical protein HOP40_19910 [Pseudonocardia broussonetiae]
MTTGTAMRGDTAASRAPSTAITPTTARRLGRSRRLSIGALLIVLGAVAAVVVFQQIGDRVPAIGIARAVPFGQQVTEQDLRQILLPSGSELALVEWERTDEIVGRFAVTDLLPGQIMTRDAVTAERLPGPGQAIVGVAVEQGQVPVTPMAPRDQVLVVDAGESSGSGVDANVLRTGPADVGGRRTVDLLVSDVDAPRVARLAEAGRAVLVLVARR